MSTWGLLLAAGAGKRMGRPKALVDDWLEHSVEALQRGGCERAVVILGAEAEAARRVLAASRHRGSVTELLATDWVRGMSESLRSGLVALEEAPHTVTSAMVHLVDLPDVTHHVVRRVLGRANNTAVLRRASYAGAPGHPVLVGRAHWAELVSSLSGDRGAAEYLTARSTAWVDCTDLASGTDVDFPENG